MAGPEPAPKSAVPGVKHIIVVGSGKGGVGKSTVATNLALAFAAEGLKTGILDADLYGPSIPKLLGIEGKPAVREDGIFSPHKAYGLSAISIGSMLSPGQAVVWRGPMATSALRQLLRETDWGGLDLLVVDLPPGTGDIQISLFQQAELSGAVIVSTPQDLALIDAQKAVDMMKRLSIPLLGLVENMSYFIAPDTGKRYDIFGHGGAARAAELFGMPFLGEVPLDMAIRETSDSGRPVMATNPNGPQSAAFRPLSAKSCRATRRCAAEMLRVERSSLADVTRLLAFDPVARADDERATMLASWAAKGQVQIGFVDAHIVGFAVLTESFFHQPFIDLLVIGETMRRRGYWPRSGGALRVPVARQKGLDLDQ